MGTATHGYYSAGCLCPSRDLFSETTEARLVKAVYEGVICEAWISMVFRNCTVARIGFLASTGPIRLENGMACEPNYFLGLRASMQKTLPSN
jgi:hypothetical protein